MSSSGTRTLFELSHLAANARRLAAFADGAAELLAAAGFHEIDLTLVNPSTGEVVQSVKHTISDHPNRFVVARDVSVRGTRYGRLELKLDAGSAAVLEFADLAASQLARFAELNAERARARDLSAKLQKSTLELAARKLLSRASGLFAKREVRQAA